MPQVSEKLVVCKCVVMVMKSEPFLKRVVLLSIFSSYFEVDNVDYEFDNCNLGLLNQKVDNEEFDNLT